MKNYIKLTVLAIISLIAGYSLMIRPEQTNLWIIRGVGLVWFLKGFIYCLRIYAQYLRNENERLINEFLSDKDIKKNYDNAIEALQNARKSLDKEIKKDDFVCHGLLGSKKPDGGCEEQCDYCKRVVEINDKF